MDEARGHSRPARSRPSGPIRQNPRRAGARRGFRCWVDGLDPLQRFAPRIAGCARCPTGAPARTCARSAPLDLYSGPSWSPGHGHCALIQMDGLAVRASDIATGQGRHWHGSPADCSALDLLGLLITTLASVPPELHPVGWRRGDAGPRGTSRRVAPGRCGHPATRPPWSSSGLQGRCQLLRRGHWRNRPYPKVRAVPAAPRRRF